MISRCYTVTCSMFIEIQFLLSRCKYLLFPHSREQCYITLDLSYTNENEKQDKIFLGLVFTDSESTQSMAVLLLTVTFCCLCPAAAADSGLIFCS